MAQNQSDKKQDEILKLLDAIAQHLGIQIQSETAEKRAAKETAAAFYKPGGAGHAVMYGKPMPELAIVAAAELEKELAEAEAEAPAEDYDEWEPEPAKAEAAPSFALKGGKK